MTEETLFHEALAKSPGERAAFLEVACAGDTELRAAVEALLAEHEATGGILNRPPQAFDETVAASEGPADHSATAERTPTSVLASLEGPTTADSPGRPAADFLIAGRYVLQERIGEGGMGEVWVAKQTEPVRRRVALKLIKPGMDSRAVLRRFEQERQALAMMDHPNIAKVLDAGLTPRGQPFFAMELVNGVPLTRFCDEIRLTPKERLELFVPICHAVQHAHQKGIVHRDLKPANILVTMIDAGPVPKVIDFGVAKATAGKLTDETLSTQFGAVVGTLEYMSPEQAGYSGEDIDTRADIYSLGVILYELLTGLRPIDAKRLKKAAVTEMIRIIREEEPSKPSTRLSTDESLPSLAAMRQIEPRKLMHMLKGELDWVVMKSLEKRRDRRYETANALARDIQRYLDNEPVEARPPSAVYRFRKFVGRNKVQVVAAALVFLALVAGIAGMAVGMVRAQRSAEAERSAKIDAEARRAEAERERIRAEAGEKLAARRLVQVEQEKRKADEQRQKAESEGRIALAVRDFLQNKLLSQADVAVQFDSLRKRGGDIGQAKPNPTIGELLDRAAGELGAVKIEQSFPHQPEVQAEILSTVGNTYRSVGEYERAVAFLERALLLRRSHLGPEHPGTLSIMAGLTTAYIKAGKLKQGIEMGEEVQKRQHATLGAQHEETIMSMANLAWAYLEVGNYNLAIPMLQEAVKNGRATLGPGHRYTRLSMSYLGAAYIQVGRLDLGIPLYEETLELDREEDGVDHPGTLSAMHNLAVAYEGAGKSDLALKLRVENLRLTKNKLGPDHPDTLSSMRRLADVYTLTNRFDLSTPLLDECLKLAKARLGAGHPATVGIMNSFGVNQRRAGKPDQAIPYLEEVLRVRRATMDADHPEIIISMNNLAWAYRDAGKVGEAIALFKEALRLSKAKLGREHFNTIAFMTNLAWAYEAADQSDLAMPLYEESLALGKAKMGADHSLTLVTMYGLGRVLLRQKKWTEAESLLREGLSIRERKEPDAWNTFDTLSLLGGALLGQRRYAEAETMLLKSYEEIKKRKSKISDQNRFRLREAAERLVQLYEATRKPDEAARWRKEVQMLKDAEPTPKKKP